ncbi:MAG TPA: hypothetical protein VNZ64_12325 [Candidatus Acidoferrum sp.]|nr:hypothetical protein [Candidatus Acidoferrum sp.]
MEELLKTALYVVMRAMPSADNLQHALERLRATLRPAVPLAVKSRQKSPIRNRELISAKIAKESVLRGPISESLREWVNSGCLPKMSKEDALFLWDRFLHASAFGGWLQKGGFYSERPESDVLIWLLIESWDQVGCVNWAYELLNPQY